MCHDVVFVSWHEEQSCVMRSGHSRGSGASGSCSNGPTNLFSSCRFQLELQILEGLLVLPDIPVLSLPLVTQRQRRGPDCVALQRAAATSRLQITMADTGTPPPGLPELERPPCSKEMRGPTPWCNWVIKGHVRTLPWSIFSSVVVFYNHTS